MKTRTLQEFCENSAEKFGGNPDDYCETHDLIMGLCTVDSSLGVQKKIHTKEFMTYILCHILEASVLTKSDGGIVSVQQVGEEHLRYIYSFVPTKARWNAGKKRKA